MSHHHPNLPLLQCRAMVWSSKTSKFTIITMQGNGLELNNINIYHYYNAGQWFGAPPNHNMSISLHF